MDVRQLNYFKVIVDEGNLTRAAEKLHMAQPPLSQMLKKLEDEVGATLIERYRAKWRLTEAGKVIYDLAEQMENKITHAKRYIGELVDGQRGELRIGMAPSCIATCLEAIALFREHHPNVIIKLVEGSSEQLLEQVQAQRLDCAYVLKPQKPLLLPHKIIGELSFEAALPTAWCDGQQAITMEALTQFPLAMLIPMKGYTIYEQVKTTLLSLNSDVHIAYECETIAVVLALVARKQCATILPKQRLQPYEKEQVTWLPIQDLELTIQPTIIWTEASYPSAALTHFLQRYA